MTARSPDRRRPHAIGAGSAIPGAVPAQSGTVLVAFASKRGGEIAGIITDTLRSEGLEPVCLRADRVEDVERYSAVVVGADLHASRWLREGRRFVAKNAAALRTRPVWMFSIGEFAQDELPPVRAVGELVARVGARGHVTFGGCLMRDDRIRSWARIVAHDLIAHPVASHYVPPPRELVLSTLCLVTGITAIAGGAALVAGPDGHLVHLTPLLLEHTPFSTFLIPGLLLATAVGLANVVAGLAVRRHRKHAHATATVAGLMLWGWIVAEMQVLHTARVLQIAFLVLSIMIVGLALRPRAAWNRESTTV